MAGARLSVTKGHGEERSYEIDADVFTIGRYASNDIQLPDSKVSRSHARIERKSDGYIVRDLKSENGTIVNGEPIIDKKLLKNGDELRIGETTFVFEVDESSENETLAHSKRFYETTTVTRVDITTSISDPAETILFDTERASVSLEILKKSHERLRSLYQVGNAIKSLGDPKDLIERILDIVFQAIPADGGSIMLLDEKSGELTYSASKAINRTEPPREHKVSRTVIARAVEKGVSILCADTGTHEELKDAPIVRLHEIKSVMCVPLKAQERVLGVISLEMRESSGSFTEEDLAFLTAIARQAAIAIENAGLQQEVLQKRLWERQLVIAREIQNTFLPQSLPDLKGVELAANTLPAMKVGGDFYDVIELEDGRLGLAIGDVAGKGIDAALYMARLTSDFRSLAHSGKSPSEVLMSLNEILLARSVRGIFASVIYLVLDRESGVFTVSNAGHPPIAVLRGDSSEVEYVQTDAAPLGVTKSLGFPDEEFEIDVGDIAILYTDGVIETQDAPNNVFSLDRLSRVIVGNRELGCEGILERIFDGLDRFRGEMIQRDDVTLLAFRLEPQA